LPGSQRRQQNGHCQDGDEIRVLPNRGIKVPAHACGLDDECNKCLASRRRAERLIDAVIYLLVLVCGRHSAEQRAGENKGNNPKNLTVSLVLFMFCLIIGWFYNPANRKEYFPLCDQGKGGLAAVVLLQKVHAVGLLAAEKILFDLIDTHLHWVSYSATRGRWDLKPAFSFLRCSNSASFGPSWVVFGQRGKIDAGRVQPAAVSAIMS